MCTRCDNDVLGANQFSIDFDCMLVNEMSATFDQFNAVAFEAAIIG